MLGCLERGLFERLSRGQQRLLGVPHNITGAAKATARLMQLFTSGKQPSLQLQCVPRLSRLVAAFCRRHLRTPRAPRPSISRRCRSLFTLVELAGSAAALCDNHRHDAGATTSRIAVAATEPLALVCARCSTTALRPVPSKPVRLDHAAGPTR
jgi:hypothetical protein